MQLSVGTLAREVITNVDFLALRMASVIIIFKLLQIKNLQFIVHCTVFSQLTFVDSIHETKNRGLYFVPQTINFPPSPL